MTPPRATRIGVCDVCERETEVRAYADEHDCYAFCLSCDDALREAWDAMSPEEQAKTRAEANG